MARLNKNDKKPRKISSKKSNALGYAKRQSRHSNKEPGDVYEYAPDSKIRRSKVSLDVGRDEEDLVDGHGGDEDSDGDDVEDMRMRARLVGEGEEIDSDDDEDISSDAAFEESDEERFAGMGFSDKKKNKKTLSKAKPAVHFADVDLNEDDVASEAMDDSQDEFFDILDVFDGKAEVDEISESKNQRHDVDSKGSTVTKMIEESIDEDEGEDDESEDEDEDEVGGSDDDDNDDEIIALSASDEEPSLDALASLETFVSGLDTSHKRKASPETNISDTRARKRRMINERTESGVENEFGVRASGSTKLQLDDLLAPLSSHSSNIKNSVKILNSSSGAAKLSAPLPQRTQDRVNREAAYEKTKEEVDKWNGTMKRIREAEHLSFPLQVQPDIKVSNLELVSKFKPTTELENSVDKLLKSAGMRDDGEIQQTESLAMNHLSVEQVVARRNELRKMRELMFRAEAKAKRISKIKSKEYRRIKKREKEKTAKKLDEGGEEEDDGQESRLKKEIERARERATLRHKNTGKWAKAMKAKGELDVDERREILEMLERGEQLRKKISGVKESDDENNDSDDSEVDIDGLEKTEAGPSNEHTGFNDDDEGDDQEEDEDEIKAGGPSVTRTGGRAVYRPAPSVGQMTAKTLTSLASDSSSVTLQSADLQSSPTPDPQSSSRPVPMPSDDDSNPWLAPRAYATSKAPRKRNEVMVGKGSDALDKSKNKLGKQAKKRAEEQERQKDDAVVEISVNDVITMHHPPHPNESQKKKDLQDRTKVQEPLDDSDENSEVDEQEKALGLKGKRKVRKAFEQRDLVARAFAGDNVVQAFEDAKQRETAEDAPHSVDTTIPGWGSWGGTGARTQPTKPHLIKKIAGVDPTTRSDYNKKHVIISEKRDKKAAKYMVKDLPYPYTSKAQYERSIDTPLGTEWNTRVGFQRGTLPKVVKKMGTVIDPLQKMF